MFRGMANSLLWLYVLAALLEVAGLALTVSAVSIRKPESEEDGLYPVGIASPWRVALGPTLIVAGVIVGLLGNVVSAVLAA
ncbi:hypothetical protein EV589_5816 [Mycobacterium sp. BK558]|jgi:hypothetical protein|nr:hypothetical protein EV589_5816 [Mycobacterium sp. BK558]